MASEKRIGIIGGTFNPIHKGHLMLAKYAYIEHNLDKVLFMPAPMPPHKDNTTIESQVHRENMVKLAIKNMEYFEYSDFESKREGKSYTYKTLELLKKENPDVEYFFIMGADSLFQFETWKNPQLIVKYATLIVAKRNDIDDNVFYNKVNELQEKYECEILTVSMEEVPLSSTQLRLSVANGCDISKYTGVEVYKYICDNNMYDEFKCRIQTFADTTSLCADLKKRLNSARYDHSISVAHMCAALAMRFDGDVFTAYTAGLFHDIAKCIPDEEILDICAKNCIKISSVEKQNPYLLHGKVGAHIAKKEYNMYDEDILNSIIYHTTGRPDMSLLEKIVFVADYIEPLRNKVPNLSFIRKVVFEDLDKGVCLILNNILSYLTKTGQNIDDTTQKAYEYYKCI